MNTVVPGGVGLVLSLLLLIGAYLAYWVVRLGVRHGIRDSRREAGGPGAGTAPSPDGSSGPLG